MVFSSSAFAHIDNFDQAVKDLSPLPVSAKQCEISIADKINGLIFNSNEFEVIANTGRADGAKYLSLWSFHLGTDDSNLLATVTPFVDKNSGLLLHILIVNKPRNHFESRKQESVELIGSQTMSHEVAFHGWSNNKFDFRDAGKQFDVTGTIIDGNFEVKGSTDELDYKVTCKF